MTNSIHVSKLADGVNVHMDIAEDGEYLVYTTKAGTEFHHEGVKGYRTIKGATRRFNQLVGVHTPPAGYEPPMREATTEELDHLFQRAPRPAGWGRFA